MEDAVATPEESSESPQSEAFADVSSDLGAETDIDASEPVADSSSGALELPELGASLARIEAATVAGFAELIGEFRGKLAYDQTKQQQVDRLHAELQAFRDERAGKPVRDILLGIVRLHDGVDKTIAALNPKPAEELTPERWQRAFADLQDDIELLLGQQGVEPFEEVGEAFDPRRQMVARSVPTVELDRVGTIAEHLRPGFSQGETLLQKERVAVYVAAHATHAKEQKEQGESS